MPVIVRWYLRTALIYFFVGLLTGVVSTAEPLGIKSPPGFHVVYIHLLVIGWITQTIMGVAIWMFPKYSMDQPRGSDNLSWWAFAALNSGLILRSISEPMKLLSSQGVFGWLLVLSAVLLWIGGALFVANTWKRVKVK